MQAEHRCGGVNHQQNKAKAQKTTEAIITKSRQVSSESRRGRGHQRSMSEEQRYECRESSPAKSAEITTYEGEIIISQL